MCVCVCVRDEKTSRRERADLKRKSKKLIKKRNWIFLSYIKYRSTCSRFPNVNRYSVEETFGSAATAAAAVGPIKLKAFKVEKAFEGL